VLILAIALPWLIAKGASLAVADRQGLATLGAMLITALYRLAGVGVGALVRNAIAAVAGALAWMAIVENLLVSLLPHTGKWLPGGAAAPVRADNPVGGLLPCGQARALPLGYVIAFAAAGTRFRGGRAWASPSAGGNMGTARTTTGTG